MIRTVLAIMFLALLVGCKSYDSIETQIADGRETLEKALAESDVISWRSWGGGEVVVMTDVSLKAEEFCHTQLARWNDGPAYVQYGPGGGDLPAGWSPGFESEQCYGYQTVDSAVPRDVRNCKGFDCLWMRGLGR